MVNDGVRVRTNRESSGSHRVLQNCTSRSSTRDRSDSTLKIKSISYYDDDDDAFFSSFTRRGGTREGNMRIYQYCFIR